ERIELEIKLPLVVDSAFAFEADRVAAEVDAVELELVTLDAEVDVTVGEGGGVGPLDAEQLEKRDHCGQLVEVGFAEADFAVAMPGVDGLGTGHDVSEAVDLAGWRLLVRGELVGDFGKVGIGEGGLEIKRIVVGERNEAVEREETAEGTRGDLPR